MNLWYNKGVSERMSMDRIESQNFLDKIIPRLNTYPRTYGGEGDIFFVSDKYIVKSYYNTYMLSPERFNLFCEELCNYTQFDRRIPKVYAWAVVKEPLDESDFQYDYYILEERVKGENLLCRIDFSYMLFENSGLSKKEFDSILMSKNKRREEFSFLFHTFLSKYLDMVEFMLGLPESEIDKFIESGIDSAVDLKYCFTDIHSGNIMLTDKSIYLLDNGIDLSYGKKPQVFYNLFVYELVTMFTFFCQNCKYAAKDFLKKNGDLLKLYNQIGEASAETILKMLSSINKQSDFKYTDLVGYNSMIREMDANFGTSLCKAVDEKLNKELSQ